jgi:hypothetical protein
MSTPFSATATAVTAAVNDPFDPTVQNEMKDQFKVQSEVE